MLQIVVPSFEGFDERSGMFISVPETVLQLEHSLISLSKWEEKWNKPFLSKNSKTIEESADYVRCMTLTKNVNPQVYLGLTNQNFEEINRYMEAPMTATWFSDKENEKKNREVITAEVIYYWMIALNIPFECQKWHLNKLLTLVRVCNAKNAPPKKRSRQEMLEERRLLNESRKRRFNTKG